MSERPLKLFGGDCRIFFMKSKNSDFTIEQGWDYWNKILYRGLSWPSSLQILPSCIMRSASQCTWLNGLLPSLSIAQFVPSASVCLSILFACHCVLLNISACPFIQRTMLCLLVHPANYALPARSSSELCSACPFIQRTMLCLPVHPANYALPARSSSELCSACSFIQQTMLCLLVHPANYALPACSSSELCSACPFIQRTILCLLVHPANYALPAGNLVNYALSAHASSELCSACPCI
jgi:hypothetical protein